MNGSSEGIAEAVKEPQIMMLPSLSCWFTVVFLHHSATVSIHTIHNFLNECGLFGRKEKNRMTFSEMHVDDP